MLCRQSFLNSGDTPQDNFQMLFLIGSQVNSKVLRHDAPEYFKKGDKWCCKLFGIEEFAYYFLDLNC